MLKRLIVKWFDFFIKKSGAVKTDQEGTKETEKLYEKYKRWSKQGEENE